MKIIATNKKAYHNYFILDTVEAGVELFGWEVKSARSGKVSLLESFIYFTPTKSGSIEGHIKNAHFANYEYGVVKDQDTRRDRRLLMNRHQINKFHKEVATAGVTCVVTKMYFNKKGLLKAEIALAKGKQLYDKKQVLKERDLKRETERQLKSNN